MDRGEAGLHRKFSTENKKNGVKSLLFVDYRMSLCILRFSLCSDTET